MPRTNTPPIQIVGPLSPLRTGVAAYLEDFLSALNGRWPVHLVTEPGSHHPTIAGVAETSLHRLSPMFPTITHIGNSELHPLAFGVTRQIGGIAVLHDAVLAHARLVEAVRDGTVSELRGEAARLYGAGGVETVDRLILGRKVDQLEKYPFIESVIERTRAVIVHNSYAALVVRSARPDVDVYQVPMGVPLPQLIDQATARRALKIPQSAFVIASITHVNPFKRLDVALRALRRLRSLVPEALLVVAGSTSPEVPVDEMAWTLGVEQSVMTLGYVEETTARLVARAADVCVNLRHPSMGETSASLLRLLAAARPTIVTAGPVSVDLPPQVAIPIPVGRIEVDMLVETLHLLADDAELRTNVGLASRDFIERHHSMKGEVEAYARTIEAVYDVELPVPEPSNAHEAEIDITLLQSGFESDRRPYAEGWAGQRSVEVAQQLGLHQSKDFLHLIARKHVELGLDRSVSLAEPTFEGAPTMRFVDRVHCPTCHGDLELKGESLRCLQCGAAYRVGKRAVDMRHGEEHMFWVA